jgi:CheY-like chemotaxis protein
MVKILIVEPEPNLQMLYADDLHEEKYEAVTVNSYDEACRLLEHTSFDLVIVNLGLSDPANSVYMEKFLDLDCDLMILAYAGGAVASDELQTRRAARLSNLSAATAA